MASVKHPSPHWQQQQQKSVQQLFDYKSINDQQLLCDFEDNFCFGFGRGEHDEIAHTFASLFDQHTLGALSEAILGNESETIDDVISKIDLEKDYDKDFTDGNNSKLLTNEDNQCEKNNFEGCAPRKRKSCEMERERSSLESGKFNPGK